MSTTGLSTQKPRAEQIRTLAEKVMGWDSARKASCLEELDYWNRRFFGRMGGFDPFTNPSHTEMLMDRMRELGWNRLSLSTPTGECCSFFHGPHDPVNKPTVTICPDWRTAVCLAALEAINA